ncbi:Tex family protein [Methanospirillum lacunae]|uniref:RNA-binding transcriptional accessory protein n=2 Tax=Methanospirillum lacunae TaxID=668570 RepID=A0A2V2MV80_9EURY|nr:Tex family protein [Methanospirillum lacunae]PWR70200.1 RNA-binding transcriptional accessory protein [Methanospirillum lacunae]
MGEVGEISQSVHHTWRIHELVGAALGIPVRQAAACIDLLDSGATVPFIARYRKEATGSLDDGMIFSLATHLERIRKLEERRDVILTKISELGRLTPDLKQNILEAGTLAELEDLYLPYKPRRKTRADRAREQGLQPLADLLLTQDARIDPLTEASRFINPDLEVLTAQAALAGAEDIIAGDVSEDPLVRQNVREVFKKSSRLDVSAARGTGGDAGKWREYVGTSESASSIPSHRVLAIFRGEEEGLLSAKIGPDPKTGISLIADQYLSGSGPAVECVMDALTDGYHRLLAPSLERELRNELKERADEEAARVFASNLRALIRSPPLGSKRVLAIDPGFRTGCKVIVLNAEGLPLETATIFPHDPRPDPSGSAHTIRDLVNRHQVQVIAVGDGTAGRETWQFIRNLGLSEEISVVSVYEQGASIYSASELGRMELPDMDVTMRGAVSIGRRLLDPLAEMVKIEPCSIGVGQYQHDIDPDMLKARLEEIVKSVVNEVGVDLNSASPSLLSYVSGLNPRLAQEIVRHREKNGPFTSREEIKLVKGIGEKTFEQAAGFLRIRDGINPLDNTGVHPERYPLVADMAARINAKPGDLIGNESLVRQIDLESFVSDTCGIPTLHDICEELIRPGRDPRGVFEPPVYADQVTTFEDLKEGMMLDGVITNVTKFGAFVNIGLSESGLVHISELADQYVQDPADVVTIRQRVRVKVIGIDSQRRRISLSIKQAGSG